MQKSFDLFCIALSIGLIMVGFVIAIPAFWILGFVLYILALFQRKRRADARDFA